MESGSPEEWKKGGRNLVGMWAGYREGEVGRRESKHFSRQELEQQRDRGGMGEQKRKVRGGGGDQSLVLLPTPEQMQCKS